MIENKVSEDANSQENLVRAFFVVWCVDDKLEQFLINHPNVNTVHKLKKNPSYMAEVIVKTENDLKNFFYEMQKFSDTVESVYHIESTKKKEGFTPDSVHK